MENMHAEVRLLGIKHSELLDSLAFTSKPIDETIPSFSTRFQYISLVYSLFSFHLIGNLFVFLSFY